MLKIIQYIILLFTAFTVIGCANIIAPTGGPKDISPPDVKKCDPANRTVYFTGNKIIISFNEYIQLKNINQSLIVSPPLKEKPEVKISGKSIIAELKAGINELKRDMTYTLDFGEAIADINEGNILKNFKYIFSTGGTVDSLEISGTVFDAFTMQPVKEGFVMVYFSDIDSLPLTSLPDYLARIGENGNFKISCLKQEKYKIFALVDNDNNLLYNHPGESVAFLDTLLMPGILISEHTDTITNDSVVIRKDTAFFPTGINLYMFKGEIVKQFLIKTERQEKWKLAMVFSRPVEQKPALVPIGYKADASWYITEESSKHDTLVYWISDSLIYNRDTISIQQTYYRTDSTGNLSLNTDTVNLKITAKPISGKKEKKREKQDTLLVTTNIKSPHDFYKDVIITCSHPVLQPDTSKILLFEIKDSVKTGLKYQYITDSINIRKYHITNRWNGGGKYELLILPGAFKDLYNFSNDTLKQEFTVQQQDYYGKILLNIENSNSRLVFQLLDEKENVLSEKAVSGEKQIVFDYLKPAKYKLKVYFDDNGNNRWDTGKYSEHRQPEKVKYYSGNIEIKSNWENEIKWDIVKTPPKEE
ncbi:MAG: Ig-like domain-containing protein [Bacteroidia bacterium]|nr:Ig-like domain-containing protein [Bacteroidia bacterium]